MGTDYNIIFIFSTPDRLVLTLQGVVTNDNEVFNPRNPTIEGMVVTKENHISTINSIGEIYMWERVGNLLHKGEKSLNFKKVYVGSATHSSYHYFLHLYGNYTLLADSYAVKIFDSASYRTTFEINSHNGKTSTRYLADIRTWEQRDKCIVAVSYLSYEDIELYTFTKGKEIATPNKWVRLMNVLTGGKLFFMKTWEPKTPVQWKSASDILGASLLTMKRGDEHYLLMIQKRFCSNGNICYWLQNDSEKEQPSQRQHFFGNYAQCKSIADFSISTFEKNGKQYLALGVKDGGPLLLFKVGIETQEEGPSLTTQFIMKFSPGNIFRNPFKNDDFRDVYRNGNPDSVVAIRAQGEYLFALSDYDSYAFTPFFDNEETAMVSNYWCRKTLGILLLTDLVATISRFVSSMEENLEWQQWNNFSHE